jgi:beta-lactamase superfamily II metal-dependent hydrolase
MRHPIRFVVLVVLSAFLAASAGAVPGNGRLQIIQLDVGQGDGAVIISPLGDVAIIDDGPGGTNAMGVSVVGQLQALGITHVEHHFASHYHSDHISDIDAIVNAGIPIARGWDRGGSYTTAAYNTYVSTLGIKRRTMVRNQVVTLDSLSAHPVTIKCINLAGAGIYTGTDENVLSMVLKVSYGEFDAVYGGDLSGANSGSYRDIETTVGPQVGPVEVYKVHHHGSATSSNAAWLAATQPKIGLISIGNGNTYGHPTSAALGRLHTANVHTYWTELGTGVAPNPSWDKVANGQIKISATWQAAGIDTVRGNGFVDTFTNSGTAGNVTIVATAGTGGTISPPGSVVVSRGASQSFIIAPAACYAIADVLVDGVSVGAVSSYEFTNVAADHTITASFAVQAFTVTTSVTGGGSVTRVPDLPAYSCGASVQISAAADAGWQFDHWTGSATGSSNPLTVVVDADETIGAVFADIAAPSVLLTNQNGGDLWVSGDTQPITWNATDNAGVTAIDLAYSTDGGVTYPEVIAAGLANTGTYAWTIPNVDTQTARIRVTAHDAAGHTAVDESDADFTIQSSASAVADILLGPGEVLGVYPNPAYAGDSRILCRLPQSAPVDVAIYDVSGHLVRKLAAGVFPGGVRTLTWDGRDEGGAPASAGIYLVRLVAGSNVHQSKRLVLLR